MKKNNKKGFTLAELLIVVAIIAVLVAIAIPVFTSRLEASRETTDVANLRSAYAAATVMSLSGLPDGTTAGDQKVYYAPGEDGSINTSTSTKLGQGTATDGKVDLSAMPLVSSYTNTSDVRGKGIAIQFSKGTISTINFE